MEPFTTTATVPSSSTSIFTSKIILFYYLFPTFTSHPTYSSNSERFKMQFTTILASSILAFASSISAAPTTTNTTSTVTLRVYDDITGVNSDATVLDDNVPHAITDLFQGTAIGNAGFNATSAQLVKFADLTQCVLVNSALGRTIQLDGRSKNYADIDGDRAIAVPTYIGGFTFQCTPS
jgi:hypothetical protein